ncbi:hypothetical protein PCE1_003365 [Barthelona sp. PCE]
MQHFWLVLLAFLCLAFAGNVDIETNGDLDVYSLNSTGGPVIYSIFPQVFPREFGIVLIVKGENFTDTGEVLSGFGVSVFNGLPRSSCIVSNSTYIECSTPFIHQLPIGLNNFSLTFDNGISWRNQIDVGIVELYSLTPADSDFMGGGIVRIGGIGFLHVEYKCIFSSIAVEGVFMSSSEIMCVVPTMYTPGRHILEVEIQNRVVTSFKREFLYWKIIGARNDYIPVTTSYQAGTIDVAVDVAFLPDRGDYLRCRVGDYLITPAVFVNTSNPDVSTVVCKLPMKVYDDEIRIYVSTDAGVSWSSTYATVRTFHVEGASPTAVPTFSDQTVNVEVSEEISPSDTYSILLCNKTVSATLVGPKTLEFSSAGCSVTGKQDALLYVGMSASAPISFFFFDEETLLGNLTVALETSESIEVSILGQNYDFDGIEVHIESHPSIVSLSPSGTIGKPFVLTITAPDQLASCEVSDEFTFIIKHLSNEYGPSRVQVTIANKKPTFAVTDHINVPYGDEFTLPIIISDDPSQALNVYVGSYIGDHSIEVRNRSVVFIPETKTCGAAGVLVVKATDDCNATATRQVELLVTDELSFIGVSPRAAPRNPSANVYIRGSGFDRALSYRCVFNSTSSAVTYIDCQTLSCASPEGVVPGTYYISVEVSDGEESISYGVPGAFSIFRSEQMIPAEGLTVGGTSVTVRGTGYPEDTPCIKIGDVSVDGVVHSSSELAFVSPPLDMGYHPFTVSFDGCDVFEYTKLVFLAEFKPTSSDTSVTVQKNTNTTICHDECVSQDGRLVILSLPEVGSLVDDGNPINAVPVTLPGCCVLYRSPSGTEDTDTEFKYRIVVNNEHSEDAATVIAIRNMPPVINPTTIIATIGECVDVTVDATDGDGDRVGIFSAKPSIGTLDITDFLSFSLCIHETVSCGEMVGVVDVIVTDGRNESLQVALPINVVAASSGETELTASPTMTTLGTIVVAIKSTTGFSVDRAYRCSMNSSYSTAEYIDCYTIKCAVVFAHSGVHTVSVSHGGVFDGSVEIKAGMIESISDTTVSTFRDTVLSITASEEYKYLIVGCEAYDLIRVGDGYTAVVGPTASPAFIALADAPVCVTKASVIVDIEPILPPPVEYTLRCDSNHYHTVPITPGSEAYTISLKVSVDDKHGTMALFSYGKFCKLASTTNGFTVFVNSEGTSDGRVGLAFYDMEDGCVVELSESVIDFDEAVWISLVVADGKAQVLVDGDPVIEAPFAVKLPLTSLMIGSTLDSSSQRVMSLHGHIYEFRVWQKQLSPRVSKIGHDRDVTLDEGLVYLMRPIDSDVDSIVPLKGSGATVCHPECEIGVQFVFERSATFEEDKLSELQLVRALAQTQYTAPSVTITRLPMGTVYTTAMDEVQSAPYIISDPSSKIKYLAPKDVHGFEIDSMDFIIHEENQSTETISFKFTILPLNDAPVAHDGEALVSVKSSTRITLNATDVDNDPLVYVLERGPNTGRVYHMSVDFVIGEEIRSYPVELSSPNIVYEALDSGAYEVDTWLQTIVFTASDGSASSAAGTVDINVVRLMITKESFFEKYVGLGLFLLIVVLVVGFTLFMRRRHSRIDKIDNQDANRPDTSPSIHNDEVTLPEMMKSP